MPPQHKELAAGRWFTLSLAEQMAHIGSEVHRSLVWKGRDKQLFDSAMTRALELFDLTISDPRWRRRLKEIVRLREVFCDATLGGNEYNATLADLDRYFFRFTTSAREQP